MKADGETPPNPGPKKKKTHLLDIWPYFVVICS